MSLTNKFVSVKSIVAKLYRDLRLTEEEDFTDIIEWCGEALDFIHVYPQYKTKEPLALQVKNYKAELPCDYIQMQSIEYNGYNIIYSNNLFGPQDNTSSPYYLTPYSYNQKKIENVVFVDPSGINYFTGKNSVIIENGYVKTSFKEGDINIVYTGMVLDDEGYPMVPDNVSFREALYWFCTYKYLYPKALNNEINSKFYEDAFQKWQYYCNQAGAEAMMPDLITLENIKRSFISLRPNLNKFNKFYER